jgi:hypothetical protein
MSGTRGGGGNPQQDPQRFLRTGDVEPLSTRNDGLGSQASEDGPEITGDFGKACVAGRVGGAALGEPVEGLLRRERHPLEDWNVHQRSFVEHRGGDVRTVASEVHLCCGRPVRAAEEDDATVVQRLPHSIGVVHRGVRGVEARGTANRLQAALGLLDRLRHGLAAQGRRPTDTTLVDENEIARAIRRQNGAGGESGILAGGRAAGTTGEVEDRLPVRTRSVCGDDRDEQLDLSSAFEPAVFANCQPAAARRDEPRKYARLQGLRRVAGEGSGRGSDCEDHPLDASFNAPAVTGAVRASQRKRSAALGASRICIGRKPQISLRRSTGGFCEHCPRENRA